MKVYTRISTSKLPFHPLVFSEEIYYDFGLALHVQGNFVKSKKVLQRMHL